MYNFLICICLFICCLSQSADYLKRMESAVNFQDTASNYFSVEKAAKTFHKISDDYPNQWLAAYWASHLYHQVGVFQTRQDRKKTELKRLDLSLSLQQRAWENKPNESPAVMADLYANLSLLYSFYARLMPIIETYDKIGYYWDLVEDARNNGIKADPINPRVKILIATSFASKAMADKEIDKVLISLILFEDLERSFEQYKLNSNLNPSWGKSWLKFWKPSVEKSLATLIK